MNKKHIFRTLNASVIFGYRVVREEFHFYLTVNHVEDGRKCKHIFVDFLRLGDFSIVPNSTYSTFRLQRCFRNFYRTFKNELSLSEPLFLFLVSEFQGRNHSCKSKIVKSK